MTEAEEIGIVRALSKAGVIAGAGTGRLWKLRSRRRPSSTPGSSKPGCNATWLDKYMAKRAGSRRHQGYDAWCEKMNAKGR